MAELIIESRELVVHLGLLEKMGAFHGDVRVPFQAVRNVSTVTDPWDIVRGHRAPGTGFPGLIKLATMRGGFGKDFAVVYGRRPAVVVNLQGQPFQQLIVCTKDPSQDAATILRAKSAAQ